MFGFVRKAVYVELMKHADFLYVECKSALRKVNSLQTMCDYWKNKCVQLEYELRYGRPSTTSGAPQFTPEELRSLLQLVHPDRHDGKASAIAMTQKINDLRK